MPCQEGYLKCSVVSSVDSPIPSFSAPASSCAAASVASLFSPLRKAEVDQQTSSTDHPERASAWQSRCRTNRGTSPDVPGKAVVSHQQGDSTKVPDTVIVFSSVPEVRDTVVVSCVAADDVCDVPASPLPRPPGRLFVEGEEGRHVVSPVVELTLSRRHPSFGSKIEVAKITLHSKTSSPVSAHGLGPSKSGCSATPSPNFTGSETSSQLAFRSKAISRIVHSFWASKRSCPGEQKQQRWQYSDEDARELTTAALF